jgi:hypothetical protein
MDPVKMGVLLIVMLMAVIAIVPTVSADERNITINITFPEEGDTLYLDVAPAFVSVRGTIDAPHGIKNVSITNGEDLVVCGSNYGVHFALLCEVPCYSTTNHITVTVVDALGNSASATRNFTRYTGPPPPGTILVTGWVVDPKGQAVSNASIIFETIGENYYVTATTVSGTDGSYKMKKALGFNQRVTVRNEGYQTFVREVNFIPYDNQFNITLEPQGTSVPGFNFETVVSAVIIGLFLITVRKR